MYRHTFLELFYSENYRKATQIMTLHEPICKIKFGTLLETLLKKTHNAVICNNVQPIFTFWGSMAEMKH